MSDSKPKSSFSLIESLTGAGGSGLVRLPPPETARLPSLQPKQHVTIGKTQKKTFCPTIPSGRRVNKGPSSEEKLTKPERWTEDRKRPNIKKERMKREIIQSASVFSLGPAGKPSQGFVHSSAHGSGSVLKRPSKSKGSVIGKVEPMDITMMDEDDDLEQLTNKYPQKLFSDSSVPPVHLPLNLNAFTPIKTTPIGISKKDCNDEVPMNVDTNDGAAVSAVREECPTTVADVLTDASYFFLQLPDHLPVTAHSLTAGSGPARRNNEITSPNVLGGVPDGYIGKLKIHKSGRTRLVLGDISVDVSLGTSCGFLQELVSVQSSPANLHVTVLGQVMHRLLCTPDFKYVLP